MCCFRSQASRKTNALVKPGRCGVISAKMERSEACSRTLDERMDKALPDAFVSPGWPHINSSDTAYAWLIGKWVSIETADCDQFCQVYATKEPFSRCGEAVLAASPLLQQPLDEEKSFLERLRLQLFYTGHGQLNLLNGDHGRVSNPIRAGVLTFIDLSKVALVVTLGKQKRIS
jgi:hypothetical protein